MSASVGFVDIMEPRRTESGIFSFMTKSWDPQTTLTLDKYYSPQELKVLVANSVYLDAFIESESSRTGVGKEKLKGEVISYLDEMGFEKRMFTIRWMGVFFLKVSFMMKIKLFVNEPAVLKLKSSMGNNPVLFLPTHRSYADFCLMTYLCYNYDIELPAVAAGMDFYSMAVVGRCMRETGAFYIRRTLAGPAAGLYAATLKQYVRTLMSKNCSPMEFFIEGTRSRSNKSLAPKFGMLSMALMPFFAREVPDITIVPVNISYDRLMEQLLFAYEHLGVPKPKESTGLLLKALSSLNDHFGNIYINLGDAISVREYLQNITSKGCETLQPMDLQNITPEQFKNIQSVADYVMSKQQECTVATISNLTALVLMQSFMNNKPLSFDEVITEVDWMMGVLKNLGAKVFENDIEGSVRKILVVHKKIMAIDKLNMLRLIAEPVIVVSDSIKQKMKGHKLSPETMAIALPVIQLQLYVNPILHYIVPAAIVYLVVCAGNRLKKNMERERVHEQFIFIRQVLRYEFILLDDIEEEIFNTALEFCLENKVLTQTGSQYLAGADLKLQNLLKWSTLPALTTMLRTIQVMLEIKSSEHKQALKQIQERAEASASHPCCLSLEAAANCLTGLAHVGALIRDKTKDTTEYHIVPDKINELHSVISNLIPQMDADFTRNNSVILDRKTLARL